MTVCFLVFFHKDDFWWRCQGLHTSTPQQV